MKRFILPRSTAVLGMAILMIMCFANQLLAQAVDTTGVSEGPFPGDEISLPILIETYNYLYGALVILWGFIAKFAGLKTDKVPFIFVVLAGGIVLALAFIGFGFSGVWPYLFSFLSAIGVYEVIFNGGRKLLKIGESQQTKAAA